LGDSKTGGVHDREQALGDVLRVLRRKGLVGPEDAYTAPMLEELVHYAYFTGCINRGEVQRLLHLSTEETRKRVRSWKMWQDGNRSCQIRQNPFYEDWQAED